LRANCDEVAANAPNGSQAAELAASLGLEILPDLPGDAAGPLAGVRVGLAWAVGLGSSRLAVRPVDTPLAPPEFHGWLAEAIGDAPAAYCATKDGPQPLCSLWTAAAFEPLSQALADGRHPPVQAFLREIGAVKVMAPDRAAFANINTPKDMKAAEARLRGGKGRSRRP
jgi:molybdopterin-guanine dinucleotide biosynthesis protein A